MKYLVTGATGYIGGAVTRQLIEAGHTVHAVVRSPEKAQPLADLGVVLFQGDITDKESLRAPMTGVDGVFHLAAWYQIGVRNERAACINVDGTRNVLEMMQELGIARGLYTSSLAVFSDTRGQVPDESYRYDGPHLSEYDRTKWLAHYEVALPMIRDGLPLIIVQPGVVYGPDDHSASGEALRQYLQRRLPIAPQETAYCWVHVEDVARGHLLAMEKGMPGETYIIAGPVGTFTGVLDLAEQITGIPAPRLRPSRGLMQAMARIMSALGRVLPVPASFSGERLRMAAGVTYLGDNSKARRELGYDPRPLEEGLRETLAYEMAQMGLTPPES